ncbi:MAG: T9SS type A sorting domain-containing protein [Flavobacteriaceae bacterium]
MKKTTRESLNKRLSQYGALTLAAAGITGVNGQIIYTDVDPDGGGTNALFELDFNNDGASEYVILNNFASGSYDVLRIFPYTLSASAFNTNAILGSSASAGAYKYPFALNSGAMISSGLTSWINDSDFQTMNWNSCAYANSNWCGETDKFLGLRFDISGNTHYGWARLDVPLAPNTWVIKDFAYNSTPDAPIMAGQTLSNNSRNLESVRIVALNKSIGLYNLPEATNYTLYNIAGQKILNGHINNTSFVVEANTVSSGVYIIEITDSNTKATLRKKVVL